MSDVTIKSQKGFSYKYNILVLLFFVLLVGTFYHPVLQNGYIWDDDQYVTENKNLTDWQGLKNIWFYPKSSPQYYPVTFTTFWIEHQLWALNPFGYHLTNILLHALNSFLLLLLLKGLKLPGALFAAAIFAVHPVHVESVAWITERKNVLSGFFYLLSLFLYLRFTPTISFGGGDASTKMTDNGNDSIKWSLYIVSLLLFVCALLSKTIAATLPAVILVLIWWQTGAIKSRDIFLLTPYFILGALSGMATAWLEFHGVGAQGQDFAFTFIERCLIAGRALWFYMFKLIWPQSLIFIYPRWSIDSGVWWQYFFPLMFLLLLYALFAFRKRIGRGPLAALLIFAGTLFPALGFLNVYPHLFSFVADHFQYLASIAIIVLIARILSHFSEKLFSSSTQLKVLLLVAGLLIFNLGMKSSSQALTYRNARVLYEDTIARNPECWMAYNNLGAEYIKTGQFAEAVELCRKVIKYRPDDARAHANIANAYFELKKYPEALFWYAKVIDILHDQKANHPLALAEAHRNIGVIYTRLKRYDLALLSLSEAIKIRPNYASAYQRIGMVYFYLEHYEKAISNFRIALPSLQNDPELHSNLGAALLMAGDLDRSVTHLKRALEIKPDLYAAKMNLNMAIEQIKVKGQSMIE